MEEQNQQSEPTTSTVTETPAASAETPSMPEATTPVAEQESPAAAPEVVADPQAPAQPVSVSSAPAGKKSKMPMMIVAGVLLLLVAVGLYFYFTK